MPSRALPSPAHEPVRPTGQPPAPVGRRSTSPPAAQAEVGAGFGHHLARLTIEPQGGVVQLCNGKKGKGRGRGRTREREPRTRNDRSLSPVDRAKRNRELSPRRETSPEPKALRRSQTDDSPNTDYAEFLASMASGTDLPLHDPRDSPFVPEPEPDAEDSEEEALNNLGFSLDMGPSFSILSNNVEKFGQSTPQGVRSAKVSELSAVVDQVQPTVATFQEVTDPTLFAQGRPATSRRPATTGLMNQPLSSSSSHTLSDQYAFLPGPTYQSSNYHESYPLLVDTAVVHNPPSLEVFPDNTTEHEPYQGKTLPFGKAVDPTKRDPKSARPTTAWQVPISTDPFNLRPPTKAWGSSKDQRAYKQAHKNLKHRQIPTTTVQVVNVHTSPSISTIPRQVHQILEQHAALAEDNPRTLSAGDFYVHQSAPTTWKALQESETLSLDEPGVQTNFPSKGSGQTADHFVSTRQGLEVEQVRALPPPSQSGHEALEDVLKAQAPEDQLEKWTDSSIDHAPVYASYRVLTPDTDSSS